jgi:ribosomal protein S6--L-glutamate ligase
VVGDRVVAAMRRVAQGGDFRSNVHRGGLAEPIELDPAFEDTALRSAQILGLKVAGVDMLEGREGPQVMEVNSSPGLEGIETVTKLDIAGVIIDYMAARVDFPDIDVRQRLTVSPSYGVAEIMVPEGSDMVGKSIETTGLRDKDISVLTLNRNSNIISNPKSSRVLEANDRLLCYGKLDSMRGLIPEKRQRKRKPKVLKLDPDLIDSLESNA